MTLFKRKNRLSPEDLAEGRELVRLVGSVRFIAETVKKNTALFPNGKAELAKWQTLATLVDQRKNEFLGAAIARAGIQGDIKASVNFENGKITVIDQ